MIPSLSIVLLLPLLAFNLMRSPTQVSISLLICEKSFFCINRITFSLCFLYCTGYSGGCQLKIIFFIFMKSFIIFPFSKNLLVFTYKFNVYRSFAVKILSQKIKIFFLFSHRKGFLNNTVCYTNNYYKILV